VAGLLDDRATRVLRSALDGLALRQQAISSNVANLDTPGYKASRVSFEHLLQDQIQQRAQPQMYATDEKHIDPGATGAPVITRDESTSMRADGNNVDLDWEMARLAETLINYNAVSELVSLKLAILRNVINST